MVSTRLEYIKQIVSSLPETPGVYQYYNEDGLIIYVGKAKNLKRRVSSYFNKTQNSAKVKVLVKKIYDLKYIVVNTEADALLLENNLIKKHQPRYNVLLKDGKTYPWLCITKEEFPRVFKSRQIFRGAEYFGPYSSVWVLDTLLDLIKKIYPIRTCKLPLKEDSIAAGKYSVCLQYHIHNCLAPCIGYQNKEDYQKMIVEIKEIAKGNSRTITEYLLREIQKLADNYQFEKAQELKLKYEALLQYQSKTIITTTHDDNLDVFGYEEQDDIAYINILRISKGSIIQGFTIECHRKLDESKEELLAIAILELRSRLGSKSKQIIVPFLPELELNDTQISIPQKGDKKKLLDLSLQNVKQYRIDRLKQSEKLSAEQKYTQVLKDLQKTLHLDRLPIHIECFDNSNISGSNAVAACIVYRKAKPYKSDYRKYNIKTVQGADDYASMREVVFRRYQRMINENIALPDLIIADGGIGQMNAIRDVLVTQLGLSIPIAGLAKNDRHQTKELLFGFPPQVIGLKPTDSLFKFLSGIQNEVHRFAISFHREKRSKTQIHSELDEIKGIGKKSISLLLLHFKSVKRIQMAEKEELSKIIGNARASVVYEYFSRSLTPPESSI